MPALAEAKRRNHDREKRSGNGEAIVDLWSWIRIVAVDEKNGRASRRVGDGPANQFFNFSYLEYYEMASKITGEECR